jgi:tight adherence protein C
MLGAGLLFVAGTLALSLMGVATAERRGVARSVAAINALNAAPDLLKSELERPFAERVLAPLGDRFIGLGRRLVRADTVKKLQHRLDVAGNPPGWDVNRILGLKVLAMGILGVLGFLYSSSTEWPFVRVVLTTAGATVVGYVLPNILLNNAGAKREELMRKALPDALDLLTVSVEAGLAFDAAVGRVARNTEGPLAQEFGRLLKEMQIGRGRVEAMRGMAERSSLDDLRGFCTSMVQADSLGIPIGRVLRIQSQEMRTKRRQRAEEKAQQVPVKIMVPLVLFILPCLFLVIMGPAAIGMMKAFS